MFSGGSENSKFPSFLGFVVWFCLFVFCGFFCLFILGFCLCFLFLKM